MTTGQIGRHDQHALGARARRERADQPAQRAARPGAVGHATARRVGRRLAADQQHLLAQRGEAARHASRPSDAAELEAAPCRGPCARRRRPTSTAPATFREAALARHALR